MMFERTIDIHRKRIDEKASCEQMPRIFKTRFWVSYVVYPFL